MHNLSDIVNKTIVSTDVSTDTCRITISFSDKTFISFETFEDIIYLNNGVYSEKNKLE